MFLLTITFTATAENFHIVTEGDTPWDIAYNYTGDGTKWTEIIGLRTSEKRGNITFVKLIPKEIYFLPGEWFLNTNPGRKTALQLLKKSPTAKILLPFLLCLLAFILYILYRTRQALTGFCQKLIQLWKSSKRDSDHNEHPKEKDVKEKTVNLAKVSPVFPGEIPLEGPAWENSEFNPTNFPSVIVGGLDENPARAASQLYACYPKRTIKQVEKGTLKRTGKNALEYIPVPSMAFGDDVNRPSALKEGTIIYRTTLEDDNLEYYLQHCGNLCLEEKGGKFELPEGWIFIPI